MGSENTNLKTVQIHTDAEKLSAAYALNMCTVSVSQIVDFNDVYILEQEYDAILNNLDLKKIPKDEALLNILSELLNTITFFRIQELKKEQIEEEYQQRMKNAIWSAVPSLSIFVSGHPIAIAMSLATTIGTGYMNYRKEKVKAANEKEKAEMELQITAIEQFNALRRELFTTAWRLADEYDFDDRLRLTEKQIEQYNKILMDQDEVRKYARLEAIQDKFEAYPPFWYFFGHTASYISEILPDDSTKKEYREMAKQHFQHYEELNKFNILREDQMTSSFALEYIDLLLAEKEIDEKKINELLRIAVDKAGNNKDILQLCAITYLRLGNRRDAAKLLKILVNEGYNTVINAQMLSGIYVNERNRPAYAVLCTRVSPRYLYPMPRGDEDDEILNHVFVSQQKLILKEKFRGALQGIINRYTSQINREISVFDISDEYEDRFFENSASGRRIRARKAGELFADSEKQRLYNERMKSVSLPLTYIRIFEQMYDELFETKCYRDPVLQDRVVEETTKQIVNRRDAINRIQGKIDEGTFSVRDYEVLQNTGIVGFVRGSFEWLYQTVAQKIEQVDSDKLITLEAQLVDLCGRMKIAVPEIAIDDGEYDDTDFGNDSGRFSVTLFGTAAVVAKKDAEYIKAMLSYIRDKMKDASPDPAGLSVFYKDQIEFERYFSDSIFEKYPSLKPNSLMVIADHTKAKFDLIFTTDGIVHVLKNKVRKKAPYDEIRLTKDVLDLYGKKYSSKYIDVGILYDIAHGFDKRFINNLDKKIEYISGDVDARTLNAWFRNRKEAMADAVSRVYAWADSGLLEHMGYHLEQEYDKEHFLLQFYCSMPSGDIMELRIVEFEYLERNFRENLNRSGGILNVGV